jgi:hypothetical protein
MSIASFGHEVNKELERVKLVCLLYLSDLRARRTEMPLSIPPYLKYIHSHCDMSNKGHEMLKWGLRKSLKDPVGQILTVTFAREGSLSF